MPEIYFSVDIEADGPFPEAGTGYSMSSFGAVACAVQANDGAITILDVDDMKNQWYTELRPISDNWVPETAAVANLDRLSLMEEGNRPDTTMIVFNAWVRDISARHNASPVFVAWPAPFDWFWIYWYFMKYNAGISPFGFSSAVNMKDVYAVKRGIPFKKVGKREAYKYLGVTARSHTHNALDDAIEQAELWTAILNMGEKE